jgi:cell division protein FtsZ
MEFERARNSIIKVVGVGGGGCNAVNHMHSQGIQGVDFVVCNTDSQSLEKSPVMNKIQLGAGLTDGLGAGNDPAAGKSAAQESIEDIKEMFEGNTKMVFITAGMGGGTGTGAAPVIATVAREMGILTVGIVTEPFSFEGLKRKKQAEDGINELRKNVDSLIIICNDKLRQLFGNLKLSDAFSRADNVLTTAAKGIAEIITVPGYVNVDFEDVKTVMKDSGVAIMGIGIAEGENRALKAAEQALNSPLLNDNQIKGAKNILLYITSGADEIAMDELAEITDYIQEEAGLGSNIIWGNSTDDSLGNRVSVNLVAAGFDQGSQKIMQGSVPQTEKEPTIYDLGDKKNEENEKENKDPLLDFNFQKKETQTSETKVEPIQSTPSVKYDLFKDNLPQEQNQSTASEESQQDNNVFEFPSSIASENEKPAKSALEFELKKITSENTQTQTQSPPALKTQQERINRLKDLSMKIRTGDGLDEIESEPAFKRRGIELTETPPANETDISSSSMSVSSSGIQINKGNSFLHDNVD